MEVVLARLPRACEGALLQRLDGRKAVAVCCESIASRARLVGARGDDRDRRGLELPRPDGRPALGFREALRALDLPRDPLILRPDPLEELDVVDQIVEARRGHEERDQVRRLVDVRGAHTCLEDRDRPRVFGLEPFEPARLPGEERRQPVEALLLCRQLGLEGRHTGLG